MFKDEFNAMADAGVAKVKLLDTNLLAYLIASMMAGSFIGIGVLVMSTVGAYGAGTPYVKLVMGIVFSAALSLVVMAGAELYTGNNMVVMASAIRGKVSVGKMFKLWSVCFVANWIGSIIMALLFVGTGAADTEVGVFIANTSVTKMSYPIGALFCRAILCNFMVCLAVWCGFRCKTETAKLVMIFWCITAFVACGFEHSIANQTMLTIGMIKAGSLGVTGVTIGGYFYNILVCGIGNIVGGAFCVALPYALISKEK